MSTIKVCSRLLNNCEFTRYIENTDKHGNKYKQPIGEKIVIEGLNSYSKRMNGMQVPYVFTEIQADDWTFINEKMAHTPEIKQGHIFVGKNEKDTIIQATMEDSSKALYGNEPIKFSKNAGVIVS